MDLRSVRGCARSTLRNYQGAVRQFCDFVTNPAYGWAEECLLRFGAHPVQVVHDWNAAVHADEGEGEPEHRAFTRPELEAFFDYADEQVVRVRGKGRKGWLPTFRDATLFKTAYGYGLRRNETRMLNEVDFGPNPHGREFGDYGTLMVRHGKAKKGSPPKRRSVLTVWLWTPVVIEEWVTEVRPGMRHAHGPALWPSERGLRVGLQRLDSRFAAYRDALGLDPALEFHSLRQVVHHPPDRRRLRSAVRPAAGRPRVRIHHRDLHVRLLRLPTGLRRHHPRWARRSVDAVDDAEVALDAVGEGHQRLLVCLALVCRDGLLKAVELDQNDALRDSGLVGDDSTATGRDPGQGAPAPSLDSRTGQLVVGSQRLRVGNGRVDTDPVALSHGSLLCSAGHVRLRIDTQIDRSRRRVPRSVEPSYAQVRA